MIVQTNGIPFIFHFLKGTMKNSSSCSSSSSTSIVVVVVVVVVNTSRSRSSNDGSIGSDHEKIGMQSWYGRMTTNKDPM